MDLWRIVRARHWKERKWVKKGGGKKGGPGGGCRVGRRVERDRDEGERHDLHFVLWEPKTDCERTSRSLSSHCENSLSLLHLGVEF